MTIYYRVATGSNSFALTSALNSDWACRSVGVVAGTWSGTPEVSATTGAQAQVADPPNLAPTWGNRMTLWIAAAAGRRSGSGGNTVGFNTYPSGYSNTGASRGTFSATSGMVCGAATRINQAASENPGTFTINQSISTSLATVGVKPADPSALP